MDDDATNAKPGQFSFFYSDSSIHVLRTTNRKEDTTMTFEPTPMLDPLLDIKAVGVALSRSRASIYRDIEAGAFPKPLKNRGSARWRASQVRNFIDGLRPEDDWTDGN